ncbi:MAG: DNA helicase RecQ [Bernardetiaceae bacterium]
MTSTVTQNALRKKLKEVFGYDQFRGNQEAIIQNLLKGKHTFVIMPTGAGKSLCYQLPALMTEGTAIVISPLIALMKNQVDQMDSFGIQARFLNSTLNKADMRQVREQTLAGVIKLLYVAPESLTKPENLAFLKKACLSFVAIDEAHCISEWGHDFRPEYRRIRTIIEDLDPKLPIIALTATATPKVQLDIQKNLNLDQVSIFKSSFNRKNLYYEVRPKTEEVDRHLIEFVKRFKNKSGIIYCLSRRKVEAIAQLLQVNDIKALPYHAGLDAGTRIRHQDAFLNEDTDVIVATIAFGMGIDKPDVRFVVHYDVPKSIEGYYQETGRAGRDGLEGHCLLFYSHEDIQKLDKFNKDKPVSERDNARQLLQEMTHYAESSTCRRLQLLHYFGEKYDTKKCVEYGRCNNCTPKDELIFEGKDYIKIVLTATQDIDTRFDREHIIRIIRGEEDQYISSYGHDKLPVYGQGKDQSRKFWRSVIRQALLHYLIEKDIEHLNHVRITEEGVAFLKKPHSIKLFKDHEYDEQVQHAVTEAAENTPTNEQDTVLYSMLKRLRKRIAKEQNLPPYVVFQEPSLEEIATLYPTTIEELAKINGVGQSKAKRFGEPFVKLIQEYIDENDITPASQIVVKSTANRSKIKIAIIQQIDRMVSLDEIADAQQMTLEELLEEIEHICYSGTKLNIDYYLEQIMEEDRLEDIYDYFMDAETDNIRQALIELEDEDYTEEELRLVRIKFMSENAM